MKRVFMDTSHFVAVINPRDEWHAKALELDSRLASRAA